MVQKIISRLSKSDYTQTLLDIFGQHYPLQLVIVVKGNVPTGRLNELNAAFFASSCGKLRSRSRIFPARDYWVPLTETKIPQVDITPTPITENDLSRWLNAQVVPEYKVTTTAGWKISATPLTNGNAVISIIIRHQLIDGVGGLQALNDIAYHRHVPLTADTQVSLRNDIKDIAENGSLVFKVAIIKAALGFLKIVKKKGDSQPVTILPAVTILCDSGQIKQLAGEKGGSVTNLGFALSANIANRILGINNKHHVLAPMKGEDSWSNSVKTTNIDLSALQFPITELTGVKQIAKNAYNNARHEFPTVKYSSFYSSVGKIPDSISLLFDDIVYAYGKSPVWTHNGTATKILPGGILISTEYKDCYSLTFTSPTVTHDQFYPIVREEVQRLGIVPTSIIGAPNGQ